MTPCSTAYRVNAAVDRSPSWREMQALCDSTVLSEMWSVLAICLAPRPSAMSRRTSVWAE